MWKKPDLTRTSNIQSVPPEAPKPAPPGVPPRISRIGGSLTIKGDLTGEEDLFIEGRIEGKITVKKASVSVGESGRVHADIQATNIRVAGEVHGDLVGTDQVVLLETGHVEGNIKAKSVTLENGARFKGSIDMESAEIRKDERPRDFVARKANGSTHARPAPER